MSARAVVPILVVALAAVPAIGEAAERRSWLGVSMRATAAGEVEVTDVVPGSPAAAALRQGDVLLRADGIALSAPADLVGRVAALEPGKIVELALRRGGQERTLRVELAVHPGDAQVARARHMGKPAPELEGLAGVGAAAPPRLGQLRGKVVVLEFFAGWCTACRALSPELARWHRRWADRGLAVVGVTSDAPGEAARVVREWRIPYAVASDPGDSPRYLVPALPTVFLVDRAGVVRDVAIGSGAAEALEQRVGELLAEKG